ncbi:MAG: cation-translocating P-type ATPase, partial [Candidatus Eisenbacteria bacterium]|nr:cation-translocating P-type ATPase [Candidatus Eisenbacteria bacterium]
AGAGNARAGNAAAGIAGTGGIDESLERELVFAGLIGMIDPPREEARDAVVRAKRAGIRPIMITGDHPRTAAVIAAELGIAGELGGDAPKDRAVTGAELEKLPEEQLDRVVREVSVYARVNPEHKLRIVGALQRQGAVVAMTGDGVNDAPALKAADIGVAMGITGTDVSKEAADMILADDNFATIVGAVEEGRAIFANIRKFLRYLLSSNIGEVMTMFFGVLLVRRIGLHAEGDALVLPLLATQILWINLVTDGLPALALGVDSVYGGLMSAPPRPPGERVITPRMWRGIFLVGAVMAIGTLAVLDAALPGGLLGGVLGGGAGAGAGAAAARGTAAGGSGDFGMRYAQTMAFTTLMLFQVWNVFNARSDERSAFRGFFHNRWLWAALAVSVASQVAVVHVPFLQAAFQTAPLRLEDWAVCAAVASSVLWVREIGKALRAVLRRPRSLL